MLFFKNNKNSLPQQVSENMKRIEALEAYVKQSYYTRYEYGDDILPTPWAVDLISTDIPLDTEIGAFDGFLLSKDAKLFSIINIQYEYDQQGVPYKIVNANYVCDIKGPEGQRGLVGPAGPAGPVGPAGADGSQIYVAWYTPPIPEIGDPVSIPWSTTTVPFNSQDPDVPDSVILCGNGWVYRMNGYEAGGDEYNPYSITAEAVCDVKGPAGADGTQIYTTTVLDFSPPHTGSTFTVPIESTNVDPNTPVGSIGGLLLNGSASIYNSLAVVLVDGNKCVRGTFVVNQKGPKGEDGQTGLGYRYETVDFTGEQWVEDTTTIAGYNYKIFGYIPDVTANTFVDIKFSYDDIMKFIYAPVCISTTDGVYIYSIINTMTPTDVGALVYEEG